MHQLWTGPDAQGWYYDNVQNPTQVLLCQAACALAEKEGGWVDIELVCTETMSY